MTLDPKRIAEWKALAEAAAVSVDEAMQHDGECEHGMWWRDCPNSPCAEREWEQRQALAQAVPALIADNEALRAVLREVEWASNDGHCDGEAACPICGEPQDAAIVSRDPMTWETRGKHAAGCRLAAALLGGKP